VLEFARGRLGTSAAAALFAAGRDMTAEEAESYALGPEQETSGDSGPSRVSGPSVLSR